MLFNILNNYGHVYKELKEVLADFNFNWIDHYSATIEINSIEELVNLSKVLGKIKISGKDNLITYWVD